MLLTSLQGKQALIAYKTYKCILPLEVGAKDSVLCDYVPNSYLTDYAMC